MNEPEVIVLKKSRIRTAPPRLVVQAPPAGPQSRPAPGPSAKVVSADAGLAVVEVVCGCGKTIHLHCEYDSADGSKDPGEVS